MMFALRVDSHFEVASWFFPGKKEIIQVLSFGAHIAEVRTTVTDMAKMMIK